MNEFRQARNTWIEEQIHETEAELAKLEAEHHGSPAGNEYLERRETIERRLKTLRNRKRGY